MGQEPFELLQKLQDQAAAQGHALPDLGPDEDRWVGLAFVTGDYRMAADLTGISDVVECGPVTAVPRCQPWLRGVTNIRGRICSVLDLGMFLGKSKVNLETGSKLMLINDSELRCALLVDRVVGLRHFVPEKESLDTSALNPAVRPYVDRAFLHNGESWMVFNVDRLLNSEEFKRVEAYN